MRMGIDVCAVADIVPFAFRAIAPYCIPEPDGEDASVGGTALSSKIARRVP